MGDVLELAQGFRGGNGLVSITLDDRRAPYLVQKVLLCAVSRYFSTALEGPFSEAARQSLILPGCDRATFEVFLYWLCHKELPYNESTSTPYDWKEVATMRALLYEIRDSKVSPDTLMVVAELVPRTSTLWTVVTLSVARDYLTGDLYEEDEREALHRLPEIMVAIAERQRECKDGKVQGPEGEGEDDWMEWMVSEDWDTEPDYSCGSEEESSWSRLETGVP